MEITPRPSTLQVADLIRSIDPALVTDLAIGARDPKETMVLHGYTAAQAEVLDSLDGLHKLVLRKKEDLDREGFTHRYRAVELADTALNMLGTRINPDLTTSQLLDVYRELKKSGRMDVIEQAAQANLPTFQININTGKRHVSLASAAAPNEKPLDLAQDVEMRVVSDLPQLTEELLSSTGFLATFTESDTDD